MERKRTSPYNIELIQTKDWKWVFLIFLVFFTLNLSLKYYQYKKLDFKQPQEIFAQVLLQYQKSKEKQLKNGTTKTDTYHVLKLIDNNGNTFYTTSKEDLKNIINRFVRIYGKIKDCDFLEFFKSCYIISYDISLLYQKDFRDNIRDFIDYQHQDFGIKQTNIIGNLYRALFIADSLDKRWRDISNVLGLAHIIAISGLHLGILSTFLYLVFRPLYSFFHHRYFPYRNQAYDLGALILLFMFGYLLILDYQPSFLRAFIMSMIGFLLYFSGVRLISFSLLLFVCLICIALFPALIFNIGFILSVSGVFYIFLFIKYFPKTNKILYWICFNFAIFFNITPISQYFFPYFSPYQLVTIPVGLIFVIFFPVSLVLHSIGLGFLFDNLLIKSLELKIPYIEYYNPLWSTLFYTFISLGAIWFRILYFVIMILSIGFFIFLLIKFYEF